MVAVEDVQNPLNPERARSQAQTLSLAGRRVGEERSRVGNRANSIDVGARSLSSVRMGPA